MAEEFQELDEIVKVMMLQGAEGTSIADITQTTSSDESEGDNVITITLTNGQKYTFNYKNGKDGTNGVGVQSIEQTQTSTTSGGTNEITATLTDGTTTKFYVKNGKDGSGGGSLTTMTYEEWNALAEEQKQESGDVIVTGVPTDLVFVEPSVLEDLIAKTQYTPSYVGMITENNLNTLEKMQEVFGASTTWELFGVGRVTVGVGDGTRSYGEEFGEATHKLTVDEMPSHGHKAINSTATQATFVGWRYSWTNTTGYPSGINYNSSGILNTGGSLAHNNIQPSIGVYRWIRTA